LIADIKCAYPSLARRCERDRERERERLREIEREEDEEALCLARDGLRYEPMLRYSVLAGAFGRRAGIMYVKTT